MAVLGTLPSTATVALNFVRTRAPLATDDIGLGYATGAFWTDSTSQRTWVCVSPVDDAAVWTEVVAAAPPATGTLRYQPPGWNGGDPTLASSFPTFTVRNITGPGTYNFTAGVDYYLEMSELAWSGNQRIILNGGRHLVLVGGGITYMNTAADGGDVSIQIDGGTVGGIVHLEGLNIVNLPNGITVRTPRTVQLQNSRIRLKIWDDNSSIGHPDLIQVWLQANGNPRCAGIKLHRCSMWSGFTYLSDFTDEVGTTGAETPAFWEIYDCDFHGIPPTNGSVPSIGLNHWMGHPDFAVFRGSNVWFETSWASVSQRRDLGDQLRQHGEQYTPKHAGYQILDVDGTVLYTQAAGIASGEPGTIGTLQGHRLIYHLNPLLADIEYTTQIAPVSVGADANGNFCSASVPGANYVSPLYL